MENYNEIQKLGGLQFSTDEISKIVGFDVTQDENAMEAYDKGRLLADAEVRSAMLQLAKSGDPSAIKLYTDLCNKDNEPKSVEL